MANLPSSLLIVGGIALAVWLATLALAIVALRSRGRRAVVTAVVALGISLLGTTVLTAQIGKKISSMVALPSGEKVTRTTGWQLDTKWFFAVSTTISAVALVVALRNQSRTSTRVEHASSPL